MTARQHHVRRRYTQPFLDLGSDLTAKTRRESQEVQRHDHTRSLPIAEPDATDFEGPVYTLPHTGPAPSH